MNHATRTTPHAARTAAAQERQTDGVAVTVVLFAAVMVAMLTLFAGTNLLGDRFDPAHTLGWNQPD